MKCHITMMAIVFVTMDYTTMAKSLKRYYLIETKNEEVNVQDYEEVVNDEEDQKVVKERKLKLEDLFPQKNNIIETENEEVDEKVNVQQSKKVANEEEEKEVAKESKLTSMIAESKLYFKIINLTPKNPKT